MVMAMKRDGAQNFMNGVPELLVLQLLKGREMYGYEIVQAIRERTGDAIVFAEGVVYPVLHTLERDGALRARRQTVDGRSRIYYALTPVGTKRSADVVKHWHKLTRAIGLIVEVPHHA